MALVQNFDFNPFVTEVKTAGFTIASDEYAFIEVDARNGGTLLLNGIVAVRSSVDVIQEKNINVGSRTIPAGKYFEGIVIPAGTANNIRIDGELIAELLNATLGPLTVITHDTAGGSPAVSVIGILKDVKTISGRARFELKAGTVIAVTGDVTYTLMRHKIAT